MSKISWMYIDFSVYSWQPSVMLVKASLIYNCQCDYSNFIFVCILYSHSEGCQNLEFLNLSWCDQITKDGVEALVKGCNGLKALFLRGCTQVLLCC